MPFFLVSVTPLKSMLSGLLAVSLNNAPVSISLCPLFSTFDDSFFMEIDAFSTVAVSNIVITLLFLSIEDVFTTPFSILKVSAVVSFS